MGLQVIQYIPMIRNEILSIFWLMVMYLWTLLGVLCKYMLVLNLGKHIVKQPKIDIKKEKKKAKLLWPTQYKGFKIANENEAEH